MRTGKPNRVVIMGAAGRDFHNFNSFFRDDSAHTVVAFTAAQIPDIAGRRYPASLAGRLYPQGIPIHPEEELTALIRREAVDEVFLSYSDLRHEDVMHKASIVMAAGASFGLLGPRATMLEARVPVVSVCAVCFRSKTVNRCCCFRGRKASAMARNASSSNSVQPANSSVTAGGTSSGNCGSEVATAEAMTSLMLHFVSCAVRSIRRQR